MKIYHNVNSKSKTKNDLLILQQYFEKLFKHRVFIYYIDRIMI